MLSLLSRLAASGPGREVWSGLLDQLAQELGSERVFAFRLRAGGGFQVLGARSHDREDITAPEGCISHFAVQRMALSGRALFAADARRDRRYRTEEALAGRRTAHSLVALPLMWRGETRGGIYADHRFHALERPGDPPPRLQALLDLAALALVLFERPRAGPAQRRRVGPGAEDAQDSAVAAAAAQDVEAARPSDVARFEGLLSANPDLCDMFDTLRSLSGASLPVLICGETGTGKSELARAIHRASIRRDGPFVAFSCAAVPEELIESELLGHVRGAFTGAEADRQGAFVEADGGTLFFDEAADMSPALQRKLLRVLEDGRVRPVGGKDAVQVDVRIVASTARNLERLVREGRFRRDLFYRLKSLVLELPPLRDRREDILPLARHFLEEYSRLESRPPPSLAAGAVARLQGHAWPGNVRELANEMRRLVALGGIVVREADLAPGGRRRARAGARGAAEKGISLAEQVEAAERAAVLEALRAARGNKSRAAAALCITRKSLYRRLARYRLGAGQDDVGGL